MSDFRNFDEVLSGLRIDPETGQGMATETVTSENEWSRTFRSESGVPVYESKFLDESFTVKYEEIAAKWGGWSPYEKLEFAKAYRHKRNLSDDDQQILSFLMEHGDDRVGVCIASLVAAHVDPRVAFRFLHDRLRKQSTEPKANLIQALAITKFPGAVPALLEYFETLREDIRTNKAETGTAPVVDFLQCSSALWKLTGSLSYRNELEEYVDDQRMIIRLVAQRLLQ